MEVSMAGPTIAEAVAAYLDGAELARSSRRTYGVSLRRMARELGPTRPLGAVSDAEAVGWFQTRTRREHAGELEPGTAHRALGGALVAGAGLEGAELRGATPSPRQARSHESTGAQ